MSHLVAISVGPVQEFIAAARRTRDLWFGSYLLSEISRAVAKSVESDGGKLIFPASSDAENIANVILAELSSGEPKNVATKADKAKKAAQDCWESFARPARLLAGKAIVESIWNEQIDDVIEFYAAWVKNSGNYSEDRKKSMRLLAGRKNCRDFLAAKGRAGVPKSSLDGQRESVLLQPPPGVDRKTIRDSWPRMLRLSSGEELDVIGITKRLGKRQGESDPRYPSVARVAAETWLQGVRNTAEFEALKAACETVRGLNKVAEPSYQYFPFEGTVIYKDRHTDLKKELGPDAGDLKPVAEALKNLGSEPSPYLGVLVADGDKMGAAISALGSADAHRAFSVDLARFAVEARKIINAHNGVLVYAGGDDVLAFVPVDKCLACGGQHPGLLLQRYLCENATGEGSNPEEKRAILLAAISAAANDEVRALYRTAFERWSACLPADPEPVDLQTGGRLIVGLGSENVLETGIRLHHTYGMPILPGSALKGLAAHYCDQVWGAADAKFKRTTKDEDEAYRKYLKGVGPKPQDNYHRLLFGTSDDNGCIIFHDGWYVPDSAPRQDGVPHPLALDVMTPHHPKWLDGSVAPTDFDSPTPVPFLSVAGKFRIAVTWNGPEHGEAQRWKELALSLLKQALSEWGIGGKTSSGYGRLVEPAALTSDPLAQPEASSQPIDVPNAGDNVEAVLLEEKTKKGGWKALHEPSGMSGPIQNSPDVPGDQNAGDKLPLIVASANKREMAFRYPTTADEKRAKKSRDSKRGLR